MKLPSRVFLTIMLVLLAALAMAADVPPSDQGGVSWLTVLFGALFVFSDAISLVPALRSNGVVQFLVNLIKMAKQLDLDGSKARVQGGTGEGIPFREPAVAAGPPAGPIGE